MIRRNNKNEEIVPLGFIEIDGKLSYSSYFLGDINKSKLEIEYENIVMVEDYKKRLKKDPNAQVINFDMINRKGRIKILKQFKNFIAINKEESKVINFQKVLKKANH